MPTFILFRITEDQKLMSVKDVKKEIQRLNSSKFNKQRNEQLKKLQLIGYESSIKNKKKE